MRRAVMALALAVPAAILFVSPAQAGAPTEQMREYTEHVIKVLEDPALQAEDRKHERRAAVRRIAQEVFDVQETARRALGPHWQRRSPAEREEFVTLFADLLEQTYISKIDLFGGERLRFINEKVDGDHATVRAVVVTRQGTEVPVDARLLKKGDRWLIYDVTIENVSLIANYRSQFDRIVRTAGYPELVKRLKSRGEFLNQQSSPPRSQRTSQ